MVKVSLASDEATKTVHVHLIMASLKIEEVYKELHEDITDPLLSRSRLVKSYHLSSLAPFVNFRKLLATFGYWPNIIRCISIVFRLYIVIKLCSMSVIQYKFDRMRAGIWSASDDSKSGLRCVNSTDTKMLGDQYKSSIELEDWLYYWGSLIRTFRGVISTGYMLAASSSVCFDFLGPIVMHLRQPRLDIYGFIKDKNTERRRFVLDMKALIDDLFVCHEQIDHTDGQTTHIYVAKNGPPVGLAHSQPATRTACRPIPTCRAFIHSNKPAHLVIHGKRRLQQLIKPAHLSDWWHKRLCFGSKKLTHVAFSVIFPFGFGLLTSMTVMDVIRRHQYRLDTFECSREGKFLSPHYTTPMRLQELKTEWKLAAYKNHDGSLGDLIKLIFIETRFFLTWREISTYLQILNILVFGSFTISLYIGIYIAQYGSKTLWLNQIRLQVRGCIESLIKSSVKTRNLDHDYAEENNNNLRRLTLAYLNFELFRREQKSYQSLTDFLVTQMILMNAPLIIMTYLTLTVLRDEDTVITTLLVSYVFSFLNIYLLTSAIRTNMVLKLMKDLPRLLAYATANHLEQTLMARLWSAQILNYSETLSCFAPKLFGIPISFDRIVNLNAYLLVFWVFALKSSD